MDCLICYKIFIKDFEFEDKPATTASITAQHPDLTLNVGKLLSVSSQVLADAVRNDFLCYSCINNFSNIDDLYKELESINSKLANYKDKVEKQLRYSKILSDVQISNGQFMSRSSSARLELLEELKRQEQQEEATLQSHSENSSTTGTSVAGPIPEIILSDERVEQFPDNDIKIEVDYVPVIDRDPLENTDDKDKENSASGSLKNLNIFLEPIRLPSGISTCDVKTEPIASFIGRNERKSQDGITLVVDLTQVDSDDEDKSLPSPSTSNNTAAVVTESKAKKSHRRRKKRLLYHDRVYKCAICKRKYSSASVLDKHLKTWHSSNPKSKSTKSTSNAVLTCTSCKKLCTTETELKSHQAKDDQELEESVECNKCESTFRSNNCLKYHENQKHVVGRSRNGHECQHCKRKFAKEHILTLHLKDYDENVSKNCEYCPALFHGSRCLYYHCMTEHNELFLQCKYCQKSLSSEFKRIEHEKLHTRDDSVPGQPRIRSPSKAMKNIDTSNSSRSSRNVESSAKKVVNSNNPKVYSCKDCHKCFKSVRYYKDHIRRTRSVPKKCKFNECNKEFYRRGCMRYHNSVEHQQTSNTTVSARSQNSKRKRSEYNFCLICQIKCDSTEEFKEHNKTEHSITDSNNCPVCFRHFTHNYSLRSHLLVHLGVNPYKCSIEGCTMSFHRKDKLANHERNHSSTISRVSRRTRITLISQVFTCTYCPQVQFSLQEQLRMHLASEHDEFQTFPCRKAGCMKKFKLAIVRNLHEKTHKVAIKGGEKEACAFCGKSFRSKNALACHVNVIHTKERTFMCTINNCGKKFMTSSCLQMHIKRHPNQTKHKYPCNLCEKKAKSSAELKNHLQNYHSISNEVVNNQQFGDQVVDEGNEQTVPYYPSVSVLNDVTDSNVEVEINDPQKITNTTYQIIKNSDKTLSCGICLLVFRQLVDIMAHMDEHKRVDREEPME